MGQGGNAARACTSTAVLVPIQFGFGRHPSPSGCGAARRGRRRVCLSATTGRPVRYRSRSLRWGLRWEHGKCNAVPVAPLGWTAAAAPGGCGGIGCAGWGHGRRCDGRCVGSDLLLLDINGVD